MFSCLLPCINNQPSEFKMHLSKGTSNGPTSMLTPLFKSTPHDTNLRSLIGSLVLPPKTYSNNSSPSIDQTDHPDTYSFIESTDMCYESNRIKTFDKWPVPFLSAEQVARNGFYYLGQGDAVRCAFCKVKILRWVEGDDPATEHMRWVPECPFVRKLTNPKNVTGQDECGSRIPTFTTPRMTGPVHSIYSTKAARLRSFQSWPRGMRQKPDDLAEAGLFYTGEGDKTICFYCDGGLKNWEVDDDAWEQHARWFDKCAYVLLMKGRDYVEKVLARARSDPAANAEKDIVPEKSASEPIVTPETNEANAPDDTAKSKAAAETKDDPINKQCIICFGNERNICFVPCGHVVACAKCAMTVDKCPMCRSSFQSAVRLYFS